MRLGTPPNYGWSPRGKKAIGTAPHRSWETITMIGAISLDGFRGFMSIDDSTSGDVFQAFIEQQLCPNLNDGDLVVMDNLAAHKSKSVREAIIKKGADVLFLPPYSPEYNPIEKTWSKLKTFLRRANTITRDAFDAALDQAMKTVTRDDISGWFQHAGYQIMST